MKRKILKTKRDKVQYGICSARFERRLSDLKERDGPGYWELRGAIDAYTQNIKEIQSDQAEPEANYFNQPFMYVFSKLNRLARLRGDEPYKSLDWLFNRYEFMKKAGGDKGTRYFLEPLKRPYDFAGRKHFVDKSA